MTGHEISVSRDSAGLGSPHAHRLIKAAVRAALRAEGVDEACEVSVLLTNDARIQEINREYRGVDRPTDVLSFPMNEFVPGAFDAQEAEYDPETDRLMLGDIVISLERARAQGEEFGHGFEHEVTYLTVHSVLHLLGYDHMDEGEQKKQMRAREKAIMTELGMQEDV